MTLTHEEYASFIVHLRANIFPYYNILCDVTQITDLTKKLLK